MKKSFLFYSILSCASVIFCSQPLPEQANRNMNYSSDMLLSDAHSLEMIKHNKAVYARSIQDHQALLSSCYEDYNKPYVADVSYRDLINLMNSDSNYILSPLSKKKLHDAVNGDLQLQLLNTGSKKYKTENYFLFKKVKRLGFDNVHSVHAMIPHLEKENKANLRVATQVCNKDIYAYRKNDIQHNIQNHLTKLQEEQQMLQYLDAEEHRINAAMQRKRDEQLLEEQKILQEQAHRNMTYSSDMLIEDVERLKMVKQNIALCTFCIEKIQEREAYINWCDNQPRVASYDHYYLVNLINSGCTHALPSSTHKNLYDAIINNLQLQWLKDNPNSEVENATNTEEFIEAFSQDIHGYKKNYIRLYRDYLKNKLQFDQQALQSLKVQEYEISMAIKQKSYNEILANCPSIEMDYGIAEEQTAKMHIANMQKCHSQIIAKGLLVKEVIESSLPRNNDKREALLKILKRPNSEQKQEKIDEQQLVNSFTVDFCDQKEPQIKQIYSQEQQESDQQNIENVISKFKKVRFVPETLNIDPKIAAKKRKKFLERRRSGEKLVITNDSLDDNLSDGLCNGAPSDNRTQSLIVEESTRIIIKNNSEQVLKNNASTLIQSAMRQKIAREQVAVLRQIRYEQLRKDEYAQEQNLLEIARHERIEQQKLQKEQEAEAIRQELVDKALQLKAKQKADAHARNKKIKEEIEAREKKEREDAEALHACMKENRALQKTSTQDQSEKGMESVQNISAHKDSLVPQAINDENLKNFYHEAKKKYFSITPIDMTKKGDDQRHFAVLALLGDYINNISNENITNTTIQELNQSITSICGINEQLKLQNKNIYWYLFLLDEDKRKAMESKVIELKKKYHNKAEVHAQHVIIQEQLHASKQASDSALVVYKESKGRNEDLATQENKRAIYKDYLQQVSRQQEMLKTMDNEEQVYHAVKFLHDRAGLLTNNLYRSGNDLDFSEWNKSTFAEGLLENKLCAMKDELTAFLSSYDSSSQLHYELYNNTIKKILTNFLNEIGISSANHKNIIDTIIKFCGTLDVYRPAKMLNMDPLTFIICKSWSTESEKYTTAQLNDIKKINIALYKILIAYNI